MAPTVLAHHLVPNVFDPESYFALDLGMGVMRTRGGAKSLTLSSFFLRGLYVGLKTETGPAWSLVLRRCGETWGKRFAKRFLGEVTEFYKEDMTTMSMARFNELVRECFAVHGWGRVETDYSLLHAGLIVVSVENPIMGSILNEEKARVDVLLEGVLKALFAEVTGQDLDCFETDYVGSGAPASRFVLGLTRRLEKVPEWLEAGASHEDVVRRLMADKS